MQRTKLGLSLMQMANNRIKVEVFSNSFIQRVIKGLVWLILINLVLLLFYESNILIGSFIAGVLVFVLLVILNQVVNGKKSFLIFSDSIIEYIVSTNIKKYKISDISNFKIIYSGYVYQFMPLTMTLDTGGVGNIVEFNHEEELLKFEIRLTRKNIIDLNKIFEIWRTEVNVFNRSGKSLGRLPIA